MSTTIITIGGDVSKGRMDVAIINQAQTRLDGSSSYDDMRRDHDRLGERIRLLRQRHPDAEIRIGVEATGGYERNWLDSRVNSDCPVAVRRGAHGAKLVRVAHKGVRKFVRVPAKRSFRFVRAANPVRSKVAKSRRKPWTLADALPTNTNTSPWNGSMPRSTRTRSDSESNALRMSTGLRQRKTRRRPRFSTDGRRRRR